MLAAGIKGIEDKITLGLPTSGDVYKDEGARGIPQTLRAATQNLCGSSYPSAGVGDAVIDHYTRCAEWGHEEYDRVVTDWEITRGLERA